MLAGRNGRKVGLLAALLAKISLRVEFYRDAVGIRKGSITMNLHTFSSFKDLETRLQEQLEGIPLATHCEESKSSLPTLYGWISCWT